MGLLYLNRDSTYNTRAELFSNNEQGLWLDPSDMTAGKAAWRRNLLTYSEQLDNSAWGKTNGASVTPNTDTAPSGELKADSLFSGLGGAGSASINQGVAVVSGVTYTVSFFIKAGTSTSALVGVLQGSFLTFSASVASGSATISGTTLLTLTNLNSGWTKIVGTFTAASSGTATIYFYPETTAAGTQKSVVVTEVQLELGSTPTEYQKITDFSTEFKSAFPTHTLYQDSNGVTPCTDSGQPVGLILDQSRGGLGAAIEKVSNGGFDTDATGWTAANGTTAVSNGKVTITNTAAYGEIYQAFTTVVGRHYVCSINLEAITGSGNVLFFIKSDSTSYSSPNRVDIITGGSAVIKQYSAFFVATATTTYIHAVNGSTGVGASVTVDNISVREVPGNHAYQTTSGARPTLARIPSSGRRNLLTRTEEFDNAAWTKNAVTVTANASSAPDGTTTMDTVVNTTATDVHGIYAQLTTTAATAYTLSCYVKKNTVRYVSLGHWGGASLNCGAGFDLDTGTVTGTGAIGTGYSATGASIQNVGGGIYRISVSVTQPTTVMYAALINRSTAYTSGSILESYAGQVTESTHVWGMQLELGSTATNYQKVVATTDVTESGVGDLWHLVFDGSDDSLVCNSVDFAGWTGTEARRNLLVDTNALGTGNWTSFNVSNATVSNGTISLSTNEGYGYLRQLGTFSTATDHVITFDVTCNQTVTNVPVRAGGTTSQYALVNFTAGVTQRVSITGYRPFSTDIQLGLDARDAVVPGGSNSTGYIVTFDRVQLEVGSVATTYQAPGTDEMTVIAGVRKLSDAATAILAELTTNASANAWYFTAPTDPTTNKFRFASVGNGTSQVANVTSASFVAPVSCVITGASDISSPLVLVRANGIERENTTASQGSGNYTNAAIYIGRRASSSLPYNGHLYQLIIRGKTTPTGKLLEAERFVARKTGVTGI